MLVQTLQRRLNFNRDFGRLYVSENGKPELFLAPASGSIDVPPDVAIKLKVNPSACDHLSELTENELSAIEVIELEGCTISRHQAANLGRMLRLRELNMQHCEISSSAFGFLQKLSSLNTLRISWCPVGNAAVDHISRCPSLLVLDLSRTYIDARSLEKLELISTLQEISLLDINASAAELAEFASKRPYLKVIH